MSYIGSVPDTEPATDWRTAGVCRRPEYKDHIDKWHATAREKLDREVAEQACRRCPSMDACGLWAVLSNEQQGTWGALHEEQRAALRDRLTPQQLTDPIVVAAAIREALNTVTVRTLHIIWEEHTYPLPDGHLGWRGKESVDYGGRSYTKKQIGFFVSRGQLPYGTVRQMCEVDGCVLPAHIADHVERQAAKARAEREAAVP